MKHFIAFATLGIAAIGSGMALAAHFAMPESRSIDPYRPASVETPSLGGFSAPSMPALPRTLPDTSGAVDGAERAFGKATDTVEYYSDQAFGATARKVKRSVDQAKVPTLH